jgi:hypothetical protein
MKVAAVLTFLLFGALMACATGPEVKLSSKERAACLEAAKPDSNVILIGIGHCTEFGKLKRMRGIWLQGHEMSAFHQGEQNFPMKFDWVWDEDLETVSWLSVDPDWILKRLKLPAGKEWCPKAIYLEFEGREGVREIVQNQATRCA